MHRSPVSHLAMEFTLANAYPMQSLEVWEPLKAAGKEKLAAAFRQPEFREAMRDQLTKPAPGKLFYGDWANVDIVQIHKDSNRDLEGITIAEAAQRCNKDPVDTFFDLALDENLDTMFSAKLLNVNEPEVEKLLRHEAGIISLSDAGAHLSYLCDAGYGLNLYGHWVRERNTFSLEEAIRQLTSIPANLYGIQNRGRIEVGAYADLMLFDPDTVGISRLNRVNDLPGGESRLIRQGYGVHGVWVNGTQVCDGEGYCEVETAPGIVLDQFN